MSHAHALVYILFFNNRLFLGHRCKFVTETFINYRAFGQECRGIGTADDQNNQVTQKQLIHERTLVK
jgi:hypothetical protein